MKILHPFSGGIDSTSVLYQLVKLKHEVTCLHVDLVYANNVRWKAEKQAVMNIIDWMRDEGFDVKYIYGGKTELTGVWSDIEVIALHTANHLRHNGYLTGTTESTSLDDKANPGWEERATNRRIITESVGRRKPYWYRLNEKLTRKEVIEGLPADLLKLTSFCRNPIESGNAYDPCRQCATCLVTLKYLPDPS